MRSCAVRSGYLDINLMFNIFRKTIFTGFAPNLTWSDTLNATMFLFVPWRWRRGDGPTKLEQKLCSYFGVRHTVTFDSGRTALQLVLEAAGVKAGDEVLLQAYTCVVVPNAIRWAEARPVYVDINETLTMDFVDAEKKISPRGKAIVVQHTFGQPTDMDACLQFARKHNLIVIEDCAHTIGGKYNDQLLGTFGSAAILSFGSDKVISCGRGGAVITNDDQINNKLDKIKDKLPTVSRIRIAKALIQYPVFAVGKALYHLGVGKWLLWLARKLSLTALILEPEEKRGEIVVGFPAQLPNALAQLALRQLRTVDDANRKRMKTVDNYLATVQSKLLSLPLLRFPIFVEDTISLMLTAKKQGILLGDWYQTVIAPSDVDLSAVEYVMGSCPKAEEMARHSVNLPTHPGLTKKEKRRIVNGINTVIPEHHRESRQC